MIIKLNVGGRIFLTDEETLSEGMLGALIKHQNPAQQVDGYHFIDRDPDTFRWILNYLRGSKVLPSKDSTDIQLIREEAEYFALDQLVVRIQHMSCPSFSKGDNVTVRGSKFTIMSVSESGYAVTRLGKCFQVNASENVEKTTIEVGDVVMAYHKPSSKRLAGICMAIIGKNHVIQFNGDLGQEDVKDSGVRF